MCLALVFGVAGGCWLLVASQLFAVGLLRAVSLVDNSFWDNSVFSEPENEIVVAGFVMKHFGAVY
jgi:hypothetical protein